MEKVDRSKVMTRFEYFSLLDLKKGFKRSDSSFVGVHLSTSKAFQKKVGKFLISKGFRKSYIEPGNKDVSAIQRYYKA